MNLQIDYGIVQFESILTQCKTYLSLDGTRRYLSNCRKGTKEVHIATYNYTRTLNGNCYFCIMNVIELY